MSRRSVVRVGRYGALFASLTSLLLGSTWAATGHAADAQAPTAQAQTAQAQTEPPPTPTAGSLNSAQQKAADAQAQTAPPRTPKASAPNSAPQKVADAQAQTAPPQAPTAASPNATPQKTTASASDPSRSCVERVPEGKARPKLVEKFPSTGKSGHIAVLEVVVEHGKGENVLPAGFQVIKDGGEMRALERAEFILPHPDGGAGPSLTNEEQGQSAKTTLRIPFVPLPKTPGRQELTLPALPITVARASGEVITLCTQPHTIRVDEPTANTPSPKPRNNPAPRRQLEEWTLAKTVAYASALALVAGALLAWLIGKWRKRPRPQAPPPPPRPPWEVALEELFDIRNAGLIPAARYSEHFDRVSDTIRKYLGDRFGFDGLECTTREILVLLRDAKPPVQELKTIENFLREADLVKFARLTPSEPECELALSRAAEIVHHTTPGFVPNAAQTIEPESAPAQAVEVAGPPGIPQEHLRYLPKFEPSVPAPGAENQAESQADRSQASFENQPGSAQTDPPAARGSDDPLRGEP